MDERERRMESMTSQKRRRGGGRIIGAFGHGPVKVPRVRYGVVRYTIVSKVVPGYILYRKVIPRYL